MHSPEINIQQWRHEVEAFVTETKRQLDELRDTLAQQCSSDIRPVQSGDTQDFKTESGKVPHTPVDEQLATLERAIANRLNQEKRPS